MQTMSQFPEKGEAGETNGELQESTYTSNGHAGTQRASPLLQAKLIKNDA